MGRGRRVGRGGGGRGRGRGSEMEGLVGVRMVMGCRVGLGAGG